MAQVAAVVFDIGNVLIRWQPEAVYDSVIGAERRRAFFEAVPIWDANLAVDAGAPFAQTILGLCAEHPDWETEIRIWHDRWVDMVAPAIDHSVRLLRALRAAGVPVYALSNFGDETFDRAQAIYPFLGEFDRRYISGRLKMIKPEPSIYAAVEADCGIAPEALLFADDSPANVAAAQARGWQALVFSEPADLADRLVALGLLTEGSAQ